MRTSDYWRQVTCPVCDGHGDDGPFGTGNSCPGCGGKGTTPVIGERAPRPPWWRRMRLIFAWYDLWVGAYYDRDNYVLYVFPLPTIGVRIEL